MLLFIAIQISLFQTDLYGKPFSSCSLSNLKCKEVLSIVLWSIRKFSSCSIELEIFRTFFVVVVLSPRIEQCKIDSTWIELNAIAAINWSTKTENLCSNAQTAIYIYLEVINIRKTMTHFLSVCVCVCVPKHMARARVRFLWSVCVLIKMSVTMLCELKMHMTMRATIERRCSLCCNYVAQFFVWYEWFMLPKEAKNKQYEIPIFD